MRNLRTWRSEQDKKHLSRGAVTRLYLGLGPCFSVNVRRLGGKKARLEIPSPSGHVTNTTPLGRPQTLDTYFPDRCKPGVEIRVQHSQALLDAFPVSQTAMASL